MRKTVFVLSALIALPAALALGADPPGFVYWSAEQLKSIDKGLAPKMNAGKLASEELGKWGNHRLMVAHRQADGEAELHQTETDLFMIHSGAGTLVVGGEIVDARNTSPSEVRGASIKGGTTRKLGPGDIVHIPVRIPHQVLVDKGQHITYVFLKVLER